jgi:hypothetical protein
MQRLIGRRTDVNVAIRLTIFATATLLSLNLSESGQSQQANMTFFVTSVGPGKGGDLGGLAGADQHCQTLAEAVGTRQPTWRAYLSTNLAGGSVNARDRTIITSGLAERRVVVNGQYKFRQNAKVTMTSPAPAPVVAKQAQAS